MTKPAIEPGSIKDQLLTAIPRLDRRATFKELAKLNICQDSVLELALSSLVRDGHIVRFPGTQHYEVKGELREEYAPPPPRPAPDLAPAEVSVDRELDADDDDDEQGPVTPAPTVSTPGESKTMAKKDCPKCEQTKDATEANFGKDSRTADGLGKTCSDCKSQAISGGRKAANSPAPAKAGRKKKARGPAKNGKDHPIVAPIAAAEPYLIPAGGALECYVRGAGAAADLQVIQYGQPHIYSLEQAQLLRDWLSTAIKQELGRSAA